MLVTTYLFAPNFDYKSQALEGVGFFNISDKLQ